MSALFNFGLFLKAVRKNIDFQSSTMSEQAGFMDFMGTHKPAKTTNDLLEPINHDDELTINRIVSMQHERSFTLPTTPKITVNEEEKLYTLNKLEILKSIEQYTDDDLDEEENTNHDLSTRNGMQLDIIRDITFSIHKRARYDDTIHEHNTTQNRKKKQVQIPCFHVNHSPKPQKQYHRKRRVATTDDDCKQMHVSKGYKELNFKSISGYLEKKSASKFIGWQKRWFYLWKDTLDYYKESNISVRGSISLWHIAYVSETKEYSIDIKGGIPSIQKNKYHKPNMFTFQIVMKKNVNIPNAGRIYYIRASNQQLRDQWIQYINNNLTLLNKSELSSLHRDRDSSQYKRMNIYRSQSNECIQRKAKDDIYAFSHKRNKGRDQRRRSVPNNDLYHTQHEEDVISFEDISLYSNTGDILLFTSKSKSSACVRAATGGTFDHVGMIFRVKGGKVGVLEALGSGIQVFLWRNFRKYKWHEQYTQISFRSLIIPDVEIRKDIKRKLARFVKTVVNRHYGINPIGLIRKQSAVPLDDESRTFFCSELIAKAFKEAELLRDDFASSQYYPSHFQQSKALTLLKGCSFSNEMEVRWDARNDIQPINSDIQTRRNVQIVSLQDGNGTEKKQRLKSPP
eukprot:964988_1